MKRTHSIIAGLLLATTLAGTAMAQGRGCDYGGPMGGPGDRPAGMKFDPAQRADRHLAILKDALKITPEQQPLWQAYADKMKAEAGKGQQAWRNAPNDENLSAPERMTRMQTLMEEHLTGMKGVNESFSRLYAALTPEQKGIADRQAAQFGQQKRGARNPGPAQAPKN
jgi:periplasmic protein CpxP/Spy